MLLDGFMKYCPLFSLLISEALSLDEKSHKKSTVSIRAAFNSIIVPLNSFAHGFF